MSFLKSSDIKPFNIEQFLEISSTWLFYHGYCIDQRNAGRALFCNIQCYITMWYNDAVHMQDSFLHNVKKSQSESS